MLSFELLLWLSAILKLDFLKTPEKSGSARSPRGMKLGNDAMLSHRGINSVWVALVASSSDQSQHIIASDYSES